MLRSISTLAIGLALALAAGCAAESAEDVDESEGALSSAKLTPADVSILLPLPKASADESIAPTTKGKGGEELLPATAYLISPEPGRPQLLDTLFYGSHGEPGMTPAKERSALRLTGARVDPCGRVAPSDPQSSCVPELRLVFQPVLKNTSGAFEAADGAVHAFYRLTQKEVEAFAKAMFDARNASGAFTYKTLGVHPTLEKEGLTGSFAKALFSQVKKVAGAANLERVTFLQRTPSREPVWVFGITSVTQAKAKTEKIATTRSTIQALEGPGFNSPMHLTSISGRASDKATETDSDDKLSAILDTRTTSPADQRKALNATLRIDNPLIHSPSTMSCVECHVASGARKSILVREPTMKKDIDEANVFKAPMSASHAASKDVGNLHSFSWKGTDLGISDRTANESASVAAKLNKLLF